MRLTDRERQLLARAVELGRRGWGRVHPNPRVGCVVVRGDELVGEGWHAEFGGPHAEVLALAEAGERAEGAEVFVSLEPCYHEGKTPPCTRALLGAGVTRVVYGARDPGEVSGGGAQALTSAGIETVGPALDKREARWENPFFYHGRSDRPWVGLKLAMSLDARISGREGERTPLTSEEANEEVHRLRAGFGAILVGTRTALIDDPLLTVRGPVVPRVLPRRIFLDAKGSIDLRARAFSAPGGEVWVVTTDASSQVWRDGIRERGGHVLVAPLEGDSRVSLGAVLARLAEEGVDSVLCEGGGRLGTALLAGGHVDRLYLLVTPRILGAEGVPAFPGRFPDAADEAWRWRPGEAPRLLGSDVWIALEPEPASEFPQPEADIKPSGAL